MLTTPDEGSRPLPYTVGVPTDRPSLRAAVDEDTLDRWHDYARHFGVTISALVEAIGRQLEPSGRQPALLVRAVAEARQVMAERNDRRVTE